MQPTETGDPDDDPGNQGIFVSDTERRSGKIPAWSMPCAAPLNANGQRRRAAVNFRRIDVPEEFRIEFRIGINIGDVIVEDDDLHGDGVNIAARLQQLAGAVRAAALQGKVKDRLNVQSWRPQQVSNPRPRFWRPMLCR